MTWLEQLRRWLRREAPPSPGADEGPTSDSSEEPIGPELPDEVIVAKDGWSPSTADGPGAPQEDKDSGDDRPADWLAGPSFFATERQATTDGYRNNDEHLWDHLARVDQLVRAQTVRWHRTIAEHKPGHLWGMIHVTDAEVHRYLDSDFVDPETLPPDLVDAMRPHWNAADQLGTIIRVRAHNTPLSVDLRLRALVTLYGLTPFEQDILLVCMMPDLDGRYRRLFGYLQDDASRTRPSVELVLNILYRVGREPEIDRAAFAPQGRLLSHHLLAPGPEVQGDESLPSRFLRVDDRIVDFLLGGDCRDGRLDGIMTDISESVDLEELIVDPADSEAKRPPAPKKPSQLDQLRASDSLVATLPGREERRRPLLARAIWQRPPGGCPGHLHVYANPPPPRRCGRGLALAPWLRPPGRSDLPRGKAARGGDPLV